MITVSIIMITYGHENYIEQAVRGVLIQEVNFEVELIIADDNSPDNTEQIVKKIIESHPKKHWVKYTKHKVNKGMQPNFIWSLKQIKGKYIAICEGDDFWTDHLKLQKQVDFLEANTEYSMICHNAKILYVGKRKKTANFSNRKKSMDLSMQTIINEWTIPTASMFFRSKMVTDLPNWYSKIYSGDYTFSLLLRHYGKIYFLKDIMSVYRYDNFGNSATAIFGLDPEFVSRQHIKLLNYFNEETNYIYDHLIQLKLKAIAREIIFSKIKRLGVVKVFFVIPKRFVTLSYDKLSMVIRRTICKIHTSYSKS